MNGHRSLRRGLVAAVTTVLVAAPVTPGAAQAGNKPSNHCIAPDGIDINEFFGTADAIILPFCTQMRTGDKWRPVVRVDEAASHEVIPPGYVPSRPTPMEDFLSKFVSATYVIDAGTKRERTYEFTLDELTEILVTFPDGSQFITWAPRFHPLPPGSHTLHIFVTLTTEHWDGSGTEPGDHHPAGTSPVYSVQFLVKKGK